MLYFFYGDSKKAGDKAKKLADSLLNKKPDASLFLINDENCNEETLQEMTQSSALFQNKYIVRIKNVLNDSENILGFLKEIKESENIFVWSEGEIKKSDLKKIEKVAEKIVEMDSGSRPKSKVQNKIFEICEPIISRDKQKLWIKYQELSEDFPVEELHGIIFMQFKNIVIVHKVNQKDSGLHPFPYNQAKRAISKYDEKEVLVFCSKLTQIVHEARSGGTELPIALEKFILEL